MLVDVVNLLVMLAIGPDLIFLHLLLLPGVGFDV
jgi:hypothetical protein